MTMTRSTIAMLALGVALGLPSAVEAQDQQPPPPPPAGETELVFEREVFSYPAFTRRNPFTALQGGNAGGPRYEQLSLIGIVYSSDPASSVAVITTGSIVVAEDGTMSATEGEAFYLKVGQSIGNTTIVEIRRDAVIVDVEVFDASERNTMNFVSSREGGTS
jgi:hypothetical protein